ncbi:MAG: hypothetical protein WBE34_08305 [Candidatus Nitrosopolaris sp.]
MVYYAAVIQRLRKELGLARANLSHLEIDGAIQNEQSNTHLRVSPLGASSYQIL